MKAKVGPKEFVVEFEGDTAIVDGNTEVLDIVSTGLDSFHIRRQGRTFSVDIVERQGKSLLLKVNGKRCEVMLSDRIDELLQRLGMESKAHAAVESLKAPMPGLVVSVRVEAGTSVGQGDALLVLEAMKMENVLKAHGDARVKAIHVKQGQAVEKGQVLIEFAS
jgi:acetyl/propionyl-CoA carboxylase alpha subunit